MATNYFDGSTGAKAYVDPTPLPANVPKVKELGTTSAPLKSAAFFIGAYCKEFNGLRLCLFRTTIPSAYAMSFLRH
jgi:NADH dehydrogenase (ubiquinone) 1 alpha subcomplex subunit 8